ncbi:hypothetical protein [Amycolatopsis sp. FDAARGOS 1241]|uniref:hypothetical protein n=1 Tax=Amycolatopsis sp. FDAARGOS 1241 TaxID=2778070 RepID=UPI00194F161E|nr:hypothetical protein [Amycolatopsis sp. FDAARGOS 1241]QRP43421.1 hypothetical protein I6J71_28900 [Amycolatopsis sp. FDAARGOS 1241]
MLPAESLGGGIWAGVAIWTCGGGLRSCPVVTAQVGWRFGTITVLPAESLNGGKHWSGVAVWTRGDGFRSCSVAAGSVWWAFGTIAVVAVSLNGGAREVNREMELRG